MFGGFVLKKRKKKDLNTIYHFLLLMKRGYLYLLVFLGLFLAACSSAGTVDTGDSDATAAGTWTESGIWKEFIYIFSLGPFLEGTEALEAFMRAIVGILVFALFFEAGSRLGFLTRRTAMIVAGVLAIMTAIFLPGTILAGIGSAYAIAFAAILILTPVVGGLWVIFGSVGGNPIIPHTRFGHGLRIVILAVLLWILMAVKDHALNLVGM